MWHQRATLTYPRFRTGALRTPGTGGVGSPGPPGVGIDDLSALHTLAQRQGWGSRPVSDGRQKVSARHWNTHGDCTHMAGGWTAWGERGVWRWWCGGDVGDGGCGMAVEEGVAMVARGARRGGGRGGRGRSAPGRGWGRTAPGKGQGRTAPGRGRGRTAPGVGGVQWGGESGRKGAGDGGGSRRESAGRGRGRRRWWRKRLPQV